MRLPLALLASLLLTGCAASDERAPEASAPPACEPPRSSAPSRNAPLAAALSGEPAAVASRLAAVVGVKLAGAPEAIEPDETRWTLANGTLSYYAQEDGDVWLQWVGTAAIDDTTAQAWLGRGREAFVLRRVEPAREAELHILQQTYGGRPVHGADARASPTGVLSFGPFYDIDDSISALSDEELLRRAGAAGACEAEREGRTVVATQASDFAVREGSLTRIVFARFHEPDAMCSDAYHVYVDVVTAAIHETRGQRCA